MVTYIGLTITINPAISYIWFGIVTIRILRKVSTFIIKTVLSYTISLDMAKYNSSIMGVINNSTSRSYLAS